MKVFSLWWYLLDVYLCMRVCLCVCVSQVWGVLCAE